MSKLKREIEKLKKKAIKKINCREKIDVEICGLENEIVKIETKLDNLKRTGQKKCKHNEGIKKISNSRADASFRYWLFCKKCDVNVGHQNFDGSIKYDIPIPNII